MVFVLKHEKLPHMDQYLIVNNQFVLDSFSLQTKTFIIKFCCVCTDTLILSSHCIEELNLITLIQFKRHTSSNQTRFLKEIGVTNNSLVGLRQSQHTLHSSYHLSMERTNISCIDCDHSCLQCFQISGN